MRPTTGQHDSCLLWNFCKRYLLPIPPLKHFDWQGLNSIIELKLNYWACIDINPVGWRVGSINSQCFWPTMWVKTQYANSPGKGTFRYIKLPSHPSYSWPGWVDLGGLIKWYKLSYVKKNRVFSETPSLTYEMSVAIWDHTVLPANSHPSWY